MDDGCGNVAVHGVREYGGGEYEGLLDGCACWLLLNRGFARNGGVKSYQPPEVEGF